MEYALPAGMFAGVLFFFWGISTMLSGGGAGSVEERMARYAGGKADVKTSGGRRESRQRSLVDPFATLSSDVQDKRFRIRVQRDLARANLKLRVSEYYGIRIGLAVGLGLLPQVGGSLAEILDPIAFTIRERVRIKGEISTLTAQGRYSGYLVAFLPIGIMITLNFINPEFMQPLFTQLIGQILLGVGAVMMIIGFIAIQKITNIKV